MQLSLASDNGLRKSVGNEIANKHFKLIEIDRTFNELEKKKKNFVQTNFYF